MSSARRVVLAAAPVVVLLSACGSSDNAPKGWVTQHGTSVSAASTAVSSVAPLAPVRAQDAAGQPSSSATTAAHAAPTATVTVTRGPAATTAPPGNPHLSVPAGAITLPAVQNQYGPASASLRSPTGTIGCDLYADGHGGCGVEKWIQSNKFPTAQGDPAWWVALDGPGVPTVGQKGDAPYYGYPDRQVTVLQYGQVGTFGPFVCSSASDGMTCWDTRTGHGAFLSRDYFRPF